MFNVILAVSCVVIIFSLLLIGFFAGRWFASWHLERDASNHLVVVNVAEGAVFALLGLLIAFTFSGAYDRFEARKMYIIEESNAIDTAYLRIDLLAPSTQPALRQSFKDYVAARIAAYKDVSDFDTSALEFKKALMLKEQIWRQTVAACKITNIPSITQAMVEAENTMFDVANKRYAVKYVHPPIIIFGMLIGLAILSAFVAGYSTAKKKLSNLAQIWVYLIITTIIIYIIMDLELPRIGLIRIDSFDSILVDTQHSLDTNIK